MIPVWLFLWILLIALALLVIVILLLKKRFINEFHLLIHKFFEDKQEKLQNQSQSALFSAIEPLKQELHAFKQRVDYIHTYQTQAGSALLTEVHQLKQLDQQMHQAAVDLTQALQGSNKVQGDWGEMVLEKLLEQMGFTKGREYEIQKTLLDKTGQIRRPDVIIHLPQKKDVIIDAKVSLQAYSQYVQEQDKQKQQEAIEAHVKSVRRHIQLLSDKSYAGLEQIQSLEMVLLFMPIEAAYLLAIQYEPNLFEEAFRKKIILVSPSTLFSVLKIIHNIWQQDQQNENARLIAKKAAALYSKFRLFVEDINRLEQQMQTTFKTLDSTKTKLYTGRNNLIQQVQDFQALGVETDKPIL